MKKVFSKEVALLFLLVVTAFILRLYIIPEKLFFGPEQGRDFLVVKDIVLNHNITLIGSKTDIAGVFHGPIFYYLATIPFLLSSGNPVFMAGFFIFLNALTVVPLYFLGKNLFNKRTGLLAAMIFTVSYSAIVYARWLSNPPLSIPTSVLFFLMFYYYIKKRDWYLLLVAFIFGLLVQIQFLNLIFFSPILLLLLIINYKRVLRTRWYISVLSIVLLVGFSIGNFILFDVRHQFLITNSLLALIKGDAGYYVSYGKIFSSAIITLSEFFIQTVIPVVTQTWLAVSITFGILVVFIVTSKQTTKRSAVVLVSIWLCVPIIMLLALRHDILFHYFIPLIIPIILIVSVFIDWLLSKKYIAGIGVLVCLLLANMYLFIKNIPDNKNIFFQQNQLEFNLSDQKKVIDAIYKDAENHPFSFQSYTIPYWSQQAWEYLFWQYGQQRYGYYPVPEKAERLYVIIQDDPSSKQFQDDWLKHTVSKWGEEVKEFKHGILTVKRLKVVY